MKYRSVRVLLAGLALAFFASQSAFAEEKTHEGKVVKAGDGKLTMTDKDGNNKHMHNVSASATITRDGKDSKLADLKEGDLIKVTTNTDSNGKKWAVKCFNREMRDQQERYAAVNAYLHQVSLPYMVDFTYLADGIRVRGQWYPIVKMEWAEGEPLNFWIQRNLHNPTALLAFSQSFVSMFSAMQQVSIAHGDLRHGNILVVNGAPKLVDYDGMYVPALSGRVSNEIGQPNYQHPNRTASDFGPYLDNFSGWVIQLSLVALSIDPKLWQTFKGGDDCLLFRKRDFEAPNQSVLLRALESERSQELLQAVAHDQRAEVCRGETLQRTLKLPDRRAHRADDYCFSGL